MGINVRGCKRSCGYLVTCYLPRTLRRAWRWQQVSSVTVAETMQRQTVREINWRPVGTQLKERDPRVQYHARSHARCPGPLTRQSTVHRRPTTAWELSLTQYRDDAVRRGKNRGNDDRRT